MTTRPRSSPLGSCVDLPHLGPEQALLVVDILDRIVLAIWDTYGDDMLAVRDHADHPPPPATVSDDEFPF